MPLFSGEDGSTFKSLFSAILIIIMIAAAAFSVWFVFFRDKSDSDPGSNLTLHFKCSKCSHEFQITKKESDDQRLKGNTQENAENAQCPECGEQRSGVLMLECRKCNKHFVPKNEDNPICRHCGTNFYESKRGPDPNDPEHNPGPGSR